MTLLASAIRLGADTSGISTGTASAYLNLALQPQSLEDPSDGELMDGRPPLGADILAIEAWFIDSQQAGNDFE